ncbi:putative RNA-directed DNA polymerase from transposon BS [Trichonephila clavipes]|nr:putative RNA-directed DNA polymerase from transposon BS [Trichonephila clavipes]
MDVEQYYPPKQRTFSMRDRRAGNPLFNVDFTLPELSYALQNLDTNKSSGKDSIPGHFLSHLGILGWERMLYMCNLSWKTGKIPRQWKSAIVIPIHKPNKNADLEVNCGKYIEKIGDKARKRLKILKYLSGRDWGSDASTLRITYTTLVRPVLEYGYQIWQVASPANFKRLERVQLSAARIITGLRYSCPTDKVLYEADIQPLTMRFEVNSYRYFNKIKSFGLFNRTSSFIKNWTSNQRLKRDSPLNYMRKHGFIDFNVDTSTPFSCITPIDSFNHVEFREELLTSTSKHSSHPELLRQLALEVINDIPDQALIVYTYGSRSYTDRAGSGIFSNTPGNNVKISIRNPDHCSVIRSELIDISGALDHALNSYKDSIWI